MKSSAAVLILILVLALALRLGLTLSYDGFLGVDGGAYLLSRNAVLGDEPTSEGFPRPPLAPGWLLVPFTALLGDDTGYKVWSAVFSLFSLIPVWLLTRKYVGEWPAVFAVAFASLDLLHAEMLVTGALPLIGFGLLGTAWWAMSELHEKPDFRRMAIMAACIGLIPWVNQTTAGLAVVTLPLYFGALWLFSGQFPRSLLVPALIGGLIAISAFPWYVEVLPATGKLNYPGPWIYFTHPFDSAWFQFLMAWPLGLWMIWKGQTPAFRGLGVLVVVMGTLVVFLSTDETVINIFYRSRYLLAMPFYVGISWVVFRYWYAELSASGRPAMYFAESLAIIALAVMLAGYLTQFHNQSDLSAMVTPPTAQALEYLQENDPEAGVITNSFTLSLWVAALNRVHSPNTWNQEPPNVYAPSDKAVRCILGWVEGCKPAQASRSIGVGYVLIDERFPYYNKRAPGIYGAPHDPWANLPETPWLDLVYSSGTTKLWKLNG